MDAARRNKIHEAMVRFADGERGAIQTLIEELWPVVLSFAQRGLQNTHDAEDVAQEVFVRICSRIGDFDRTRAGLSWAFGIAGYEVMTHRKRKQRQRETSDAALHLRADERALQEEDLIHDDLLAALTHVAGELTAEDRAALGLLGTAATVSEVPGATLRKRRERALGRLRAIWRELYGGP
jgi:RNA polymerase sigma-70 factor (ECF subfamily)